MSKRPLDSAFRLCVGLAYQKGFHDERDAAPDMSGKSIFSDTFVKATEDRIKNLESELARYKAIAEEATLVLDASDGYVRVAVNETWEMPDVAMPNLYDYLEARATHEPSV